MLPLDKQQGAQNSFQRPKLSIAVLQTSSLSPYEQALAYSLFTRNETPNEIRALHIKGYIKSLWGYISSSEDFADLSKLNQAGYDIFGVVNQATPETKQRIKTRNPETGKLQLTRDQDILDTVTFAFCETDKTETTEGDNLKEFLADAMPPSMIVQSSYAHKLHVYYRTTGIPKVEVKALNQAVIKHFNASQESKNPARILRIPGFIHNKSGHMVTLVYLSDTVYSYEDLKAYFKPEELRLKSKWTLNPSSFKSSDSKLIDTLKKACETVAKKNQADQFRHRMLYYAACLCRDHKLPLQQAGDVVKYMADILPARNGQPVSHKEALDSLEYTYKQPADFSQAWALGPSLKLAGRTSYLREVWSK